MKIIVYTDGASRGNPGMAALGVIICNDKGEPFKRYSEFLGDKMTNNEAEYHALIFALKKVIQLIGKEKVKETELEVRSDSELLVNQMNGKYKLSDKKIQEFFIIAWNLKIGFKDVRFKHILRELNKEADILANEALDNRAQGGLL